MLKSLIVTSSFVLFAISFFIVIYVFISIPKYSNILVLCNITFTGRNKDEWVSLFINIGLSTTIGSIAFTICLIIDKNLH